VSFDFFKEERHVGIYYFYILDPEFGPGFIKMNPELLLHLLHQPPGGCDVVHELEAGALEQLDRQDLDCDARVRRAALGRAARSRSAAGSRPAPPSAAKLAVALRPLGHELVDRSVLRLLGGLGTRCERQGA
jgi:hypothetical protein